MTRLLPLLTALTLVLSGCAEQVTRNETAPVDLTGTLAFAEPMPVQPAPETSAQIATAGAPRILAMGDSMMAWHMATRKSIANAVSAELNEPVENRAVSGARVIYPLPITGAMGLKIAKQYKPGNWEWIVLNGGGNDLWLGCGCALCDHKIDRMISDDGMHGEIPRMITELVSTGAKVVYVGYLRSPGKGSIIEHCKDEGDELEARIARLADFVDGMYFVSLADMVPYGDRSYHSLDMIHPSVKGSREIGRRVAELIATERRVAAVLPEEG